MHCELPLIIFLATLEAPKARAGCPCSFFTELHGDLFGQNLRQNWRSVLVPVTNELQAASPKLNGVE